MFGRSHWRAEHPGLHFMSFHDLRGFLGTLERTGRLRRVSEPVNPELETTSLSLRALKAGGPALLMEQPVGARQRRRRIACNPLQALPPRAGPGCGERHQILVGTREHG